MDADLARTLAQQRGVVFRHQALDCGVTEKEVASLLRAGEWVRLRRGAYTTSELHRTIGPAGRHALLVRAVAANLSGRVVVTGYSGLALLDVPLWGVDLTEVHVHRDDGKTARREAGVAHHVGTLADTQVIERDGLLVASPEVCAFDACRTASFDVGVALVDGVRHRHPFDLTAALALVEDRRDWSGSLRAGRVLRFSTDRADTVGESRARIMMARIGLPAPSLQHPVRDGADALVATTDFFVEEFSTVAEFDGKIKYGRELYEATGLLEDVDLGDVVWREKRREDAIRDLGHEVVRVVWSELDGRDHQLADRFRRAFRRSGRLRDAG